MPLVIVGLGVGFFALMAALVLAGLSQTHTATHGGAGVRGYFDWLTHGGPLTGTLDLGAKAARAVVAKVSGAQLRHLTAFFGGLAFLIGETYKANANTADAAANAAAKIEHDLHRAEKQLHREVVRAEAKLNREIHATERKLNAEVKADERRLNHQAAQIRHHTHAIDVTLPRDIGHIRTRNDALTRDQAKLKERTKSLEDGAIDTWDWIRAHPLAGVTGVFAGAVAVALTRMGFGFLRCRSWRNVAKRMNCGIGGSLLNLLDNGLGGLLGALLTYETVTHLDELVRLGQSVEGGVAKGLQDLLNVKG